MNFVRKSYLLKLVFIGFYVFGCGPGSRHLELETLDDSTEKLREPTVEGPSEVEPEYSGPFYVSDVEQIFQIRCTMCHSLINPTSGVALDSYESIWEWQDQIYQQIANRTMPLGPPMPDEERELVLLWIEEGLHYSESKEAPL